MTRSPQLDPGECLIALATANADGDARGYRHPLGFWHIAIPSVGVGKIRLHVWDADLPSVEALMPQVHNHAFRFTSLVLRGAVRHTPFEVLTAGAGAGAADIFEVRHVEQHGKETLLIDTGERVTAIARPGQCYLPGQLYAFSENAYHLSESVGPIPAMTLVMCEQVHSVTSCVLSAIGSANRLVWHKHWLSRECVSRFVEEAIDRLAGLSRPAEVVE